MEDLDALAASIAFSHCDQSDSTKAPITVVTAAVDRIDLLNNLRTDLDLKLSGHVTYVGSSSMEVTLRVECDGYPSSTEHLQDTNVR